MNFKKDQFVTHVEQQDFYGTLIVEDGGSVNTKVRSAESGQKFTLATHKLRLTEYQPEFKTGEKIQLPWGVGVITEVRPNSYIISSATGVSSMVGSVYHNEAKTIKPKFSDIRKGDKLRVHKPSKGITVEGVADHKSKQAHVWFTAEGTFLVNILEKYAEIEILERKPVPELPKAVGSVIAYIAKGDEYVAVLGQYDKWYSTKIVGATTQFALNEKELEGIEYTLLREGFDSDSK